MNPGLAVVSNVAEVFSIGGLTVGIVLLLAALLAALLDLGWVATRAAVEHDEHGGGGVCRNGEGGESGCLGQRLGARDRHVARRPGCGGVVAVGRHCRT